MRKILTGILAGMMLTAALALPVMAEETTATGTVEVTTINGMENGQQGQMPGNVQNGKQGQMPGNVQNGQQGQMPGNVQNGRQGQMPGNGRNGLQGQMPGNIQNGRQGQMPGNGRNGQQGQMPGNGPMGQRGRMPGNSKNDTVPKVRIDFKSLVEKGIIDQATYEKIEEYLKNNAPKGPDSVNPMTPPEMPEGDSGNAEPTTPEKPEGDNENEGMIPPVNPEADGEDEASSQTVPQIPDAGAQAPQDDLLTKLVEAGILTQDQADAINALSNSAAEQPTATTENT